MSARSELDAPARAVRLLLLRRRLARAHHRLRRHLAREAKHVDIATDFLAAGLDPEKSTLFIQSHVKQHAELHLLFRMMTPLGWLERVPTYKEQRENIKDKDLSTYGFLGYPLLQSADILIYRARLRSRRRRPGPARRVDPRNRPPLQPVLLAAGRQRRNAGIRSRARPHVFPEPQPLLTPAAKLPGTDGRKMSKSYGNSISLSDPEPVVRQKLKTMVTDPARVRRTDPGNPDVCPVGDLHKIFSDKETLEWVNTGCRTAGIGCIECKSRAADHLLKVLNPMQERRRPFEEKPKLAWDILEAGSDALAKSPSTPWRWRARPRHLSHEYEAPQVNSAEGTK